ncbi:MAG: glucose 1-dehydrogenase [Oxalicibacterium faecigallinarum]|uniref:glucose 1-dehydrogenase n=1 Tax=Oxalicibacterium faecigallinarum TaxID=573741 RepID=UPI002807338D|nr:glucose 1-dehydrogenase [Oxalicibacterium faecigallinarum]MDQ7968191.1 glucose 1-dehydrogenase [Oxalicibacterium faecigallinarum]
MQISLQGQIAIVTGGSSGLGREISLAYARAGATVVVNFHHDADAADDVVKLISQAGGNAMAVQADVGQESDVARLFAQTIERFGAVDILVANSGMQKDARFAEMSIEDWDAVIKTNLTGQFLCARSAVKAFRLQGDRGVSHSIGKILCMSSVHQTIPWAGHVNYAASKGGVALLMSSLAQEVAAERIRVNAIAPGAIRTPINEAVTQGDGAEKLLELIPYGRIGEPEDVANAALFLVSDLADYIVGTTLFVDGGMTLYPGFEDNG